MENAALLRRVLWYSLFVLKTKRDYTAFEYATKTIKCSKFRFLYPKRVFIPITVSRKHHEL